MMIDDNIYTYTVEQVTSYHHATHPYNNVGEITT